MGGGGAIHSFSEISVCMSPPCQFYNTGFTYFNLHYIITTLKSFNIKKSNIRFGTFP